MTIPSTILVTGATGTVGGEVVRQLVLRGARVRVLLRNAEQAAKFASAVEVVPGDLSKLETLGPAFSGVEKVLLIAAGPRLPELDANAIEAARAANVKHVVKLSAQVVDAEPSLQVARWHRPGEERLKASGLFWTSLRPAHFATNARNWARTIRAQGAVFQPTGTGKVAVIDPQDIAAVAVAVLTEPGHENKTYTLTGPAALTTADQVRLIGVAIGKPLSFVEVPEESARRKMLESGMPAASVDPILELLAFVRAGRADEVTSTVAQVLGRQPRAFLEWAHENASAFA